MYCSECGCDLKENGILCEASVIASYDEEKGKFILDISGLSIRDFETKCPECYSIGIDVQAESE